MAVTLKSDASRQLLANLDLNRAEAFYVKETLRSYVGDSGCCGTMTNLAFRLHQTMLAVFGCSAYQTATSHITNHITTDLHYYDAPTHVKNDTQTAAHTISGKVMTMLYEMEWNNTPRKDTLNFDAFRIEVIRRDFQNTLDTARPSEQAS